MLTILFVSSREEAWDDEREGLNEEEKLVYCYVMNLDDETLSEYGECLFSVDKGMLERIG